MIKDAPATIRSAPSLREVSPSRMVQVLESTTDIVVMMDRDLRINFINPAGCAMLGWDGEEIARPRVLEDIFPEWAYVIFSEQALSLSREHGTWTGETALLTKEGLEIPVSQVLLAHRDGCSGIEFYSLISRDISERKRRELEQIEWSNRYDAAIRASGQVMFDWDSATGRIDYGGAVERVTGYRFNDLTEGMAQLCSIIHPEDRARFEQCVENAISTREAIKVEVRLKRKDGREIAAKIEGHFFLDRLGQIGRMVGFLSDVTAERNYERSVQSTQERLEQSVAERTRDLEKVNSELLDLARQQEAVARLGQKAITGIGMAELIKESVNIIRSTLRVDCSSVNEWLPETKMLYCRASVGWPPDNDFLDSASSPSSQSGYTFAIGMPVICEDYNTETRFSSSPSVIAAGIRSAITVPIQAGGGPFGVLGAFSKQIREFSKEDVSFLQGIANILSAAIDRLRVEESARRAYSEADAANRAKSQFLSRMSHELRTPLNAILGFTQLLELEQHNERQAESIDHISRAGRNLLTLINEVLDIARIDSGRITLQPEPVELLPLISGLISSMNSGANARQITLHFNEEKNKTAVATTDRERFKQVIAHLIANAIQYNRDGGKVTLELAPKDSDYWRVGVTDTGEGIPEDHIARLFVPFERLGHKEGGTDSGAGLGLALCQRIIKALDGRIGMSSTVGLGSTFWVDVPALLSVNEGDARSVALEKVHKAPTPQLKTVLYVEDDMANFHLIQRIVETRSHIRLATIMQGGGALNLAIEQKPSLILLDLNLPDVSGETVLARLKANQATQEIPVIVVSGDVMASRSQSLISQGAAGVLQKPYRVQELLAIFDRYVKMQG